jgi:hypothetical protein
MTLKNEIGYQKDSLRLTRVLQELSRFTLTQEISKQGPPKIDGKSVHHSNVGKMTF